MKVVVLVSGGKDSVLALWLAMHQFEVTSILSVRSSCPDSLLFHIPNSHLVTLIAEMLEIPHKIVLIDSCKVKDEVLSLKEALIETGAEAVVTGGIQSEFQRTKFNRSAQLANMKCINPLWRISPDIIMSELIDNKFRVIITSVTSMGLNKALLGKEITSEALERLKKAEVNSGLSLIGEGGEFESSVIDAPFFPSFIEILEANVHWNESREEGYYEILKVRCRPKNKI
ncbi:MAG: diphthine--ammonia ligase [Promethearchaeota archaeon]